MRRVSAAHLNSGSHHSLPGLANSPARSQIELEDAPEGKLSDRFEFPPFSVLHTQSGPWQNRKRAYLSLGIQSELGRGASEDATPGGSSRPATKRGEDGHTVRGDGTGKPKRKAFRTDVDGYPNDFRGTDRDYKKRADKNEVMAFTGPVTDPASLARRYAGGPRPHSNSTGNRDLRPGRDGKEEYKGGDAWLGKANAAIGGSPLPLDREGGTSGTSIFDPVLCELMYRWFSPPGGVVLDPFAGGSVRGLLAALWGRGYVGIDLRAEQVEANRAQRVIAPVGSRLHWVVGDSRNLAELLPTGKFDFLFTCPPYFNLELYSYDKDDLSNAKDYPEFLASYRTIIRESAARLRNNRFAAIVVGNFRDGRGRYIDFVGDTIRACAEAGLEFYNEAILVTAIGSLPLRTRMQFRAARKMGKTHQQVLVFVKGDPRKAATACREGVQRI